MRYLMAPKSRILTTIKLVRKDSLLVYKLALLRSVWGNFRRVRTRVNTNAGGVRTSAQSPKNHAKDYFSQMKKIM